MRKIVSVCLLLALVLSMAICAQATDAKVVFTSDSSFSVGGTATVDFLKTSQNVMNDPNVMADMYNAALEQDMDVNWICSNGANKKGKSVSWAAEDAGKEYVCRVGFYADDACTEFIDYIDSEPFIIAGGSTAKIPTIPAQNLEMGKVGLEYYQKLTCSDPDVKWSLFRSSLPDGLYLTQHGEIEGTPTKAGNYYVVIMATPEAGEDYAVTEEFELIIAEETEQLYTIEIWEVPNKLEYTAGEKLDMTGLKVRIYGPDGYLDSVDGKYLTYSDRALVTLGEQKIALQYKDAFDIFIVTVKAAPATEPTTAPTTEATEPVEEPTTEPTEEVTEPTDAVTEPTEDTQASEPDETITQSVGRIDGTSGTDVWVFVGIGLGILAAGIAVAIVVLILNKKKA